MCKWMPVWAQQVAGGQHERAKAHRGSLASARTGQHVLAQSATGGGAAGSGIAPHRTSEAGTGEARPRGGSRERMKPRGTSKSPRAQLREIFTATNLLGCTSGWQGRGLAGEGKRHATGGAPDGRSECTHTHTTPHTTTTQPISHRLASSRGTFPLCVLECPPLGKPWSN